MHKHGKQHLITVFAALLSSLLLLAAGRTVQKEHAFMAIGEFCQRYPLALSSAPGTSRIVLQGHAVKLTIAPGLRICRLNGNTIRLADAPYIEEGELFVPCEIEEILPPAFKVLARRISGTYVLDPGHGGRDNGAEAHGLAEKDINLDIALRVARLLRQRGALVILTRNDDREVPLAERARTALQARDGAFISIHTNALGQERESENAVRGIETFIPFLPISTDSGNRTHSRSEGHRLGNVLQKQLVAHLGDTDRGVKERSLAVLTAGDRVPSALVEVGFLTHRETADKLRLPRYRQQVAEAIVEGIARFARSTSHKRAPLSE